MIYKTTLSIIAMTLFSSAVFAAPKTPLLTKTNHPGHVMPVTAIVDSCEVFDDEVRINRQFGYDENGFITVETRKIKLDPKILKVIAGAKEEQLVEKENGMCDGPSTNVAARELVLFNTGGCGNPRQERTGFNTRKLRALIDQYCPVTYGAKFAN